MVTCEKSNQNPSQAEQVRKEGKRKKVLTFGDEEELWGRPSSGRRDAGEGGCRVKQLADGRRAAPQEQTRRRNPILPLVRPI
jgi:hypothetical protein